MTITQLFIVELENIQLVFEKKANTTLPLLAKYKDKIIELADWICGDKLVYSADVWSELSGAKLYEWTDEESTFIYEIQQAQNRARKQFCKEQVATEIKEKGLISITEYTAGKIAMAYIVKKSDYHGTDKLIELPAKTYKVKEIEGELWLLLNNARRNGFCQSGYKPIYLKCL